ncbi:MAG TPA: DUF1573 domain-containing protein [Firmicutes bacterium]|nr:DUF1573 domain-containing protein [Bacillota bacterium]
MEGKQFVRFQEAVYDHLIRHRSILDCLSKFQESNARANRAIIKAVTNCGCLKINASRQQLPCDISLSEIKNYVDTHLTGSLCPECKDAIESELGMVLFYLAALCNLLHLDLYEVLEKEYRTITTLGIFSLT